jgi:hypothetical protein
MPYGMRICVVKIDIARSELIRLRVRFLLFLISVIIKHGAIMSINQICTEIVNDVDSALGCAVVDLNSGLLLGVSHNVPYFTQSYLDAVAAAAVDMFRGRTVSAVEDMIANMRGKPRTELY